jgi:hypothetical protein
LFVPINSHIWSTFCLILKILTQSCKVYPCYFVSTYNFTSIKCNLNAHKILSSSKQSPLPTGIRKDRAHVCFLINHRIFQRTRLYYVMAHTNVNICIIYPQMAQFNIYSKSLPQQVSIVHQVHISASIYSTYINIQSTYTHLHTHTHTHTHTRTHIHTHPPSPTYIPPQQTLYHYIARHNQSSTSTLAL